MLPKDNQTHFVFQTNSDLFDHEKTDSDWFDHRQIGFRHILGSRQLLTYLITEKQILTGLTKK